MGGGDPLAVLHVKVFEARNLPRKCSTYCTVLLESRRKNTSCIKNDSCPHWNEDFYFEIYKQITKESIAFAVFEKNTIRSHDCLGKVVVPLNMLVEGEALSFWRPLVKVSKKEVTGDLHILLKLSKYEDEYDWVVLDSPPMYTGDTAIQNYQISNAAKPLQIMDEHSHNDEWDQHSRSANISHSFTQQQQQQQQVHNQSPVRRNGEFKFEEPDFDEEEEEEEAATGPSPIMEVELDEDDSSMEIEGKLEESPLRHFDDYGRLSPKNLNDASVDYFDTEYFEIADEEEQTRLFLEFMANDLMCSVCRASDASKMVELDCDHFVCKECLRNHILAAITDETLIELQCPRDNCSTSVGQWALKEVLTPPEFDNFINRSLKLAVDSYEEMFCCPNCNIVMERVQKTEHSNPSQHDVGLGGKKLTQQAIDHRDNFRFRCRGCETEFCCSCKRMPYHLGFTCALYEEYLSSRRCRFCQAMLPPLSAEEIANFNALVDVCNDEECLEKRDVACQETHACGHHCNGIRDEDPCLRCLHEDCVEDGSSCSADWCSICFVEDLGAAPSIELACGHIFHYSCVKSKLAQKWPSARITFGFWDCPNCKQPISHPALDAELAPLKELYEDITKKALQRLSYEGLQNHEDIVKEGGAYHKNPLGFAMNRFAYYPCFECKKPYFGGQKVCNAGNDDRNFKAEDLVCGGCSGTGADECKIHGNEFTEHKCQYCCSVASWYCWGKTHFCDSCHTRQQKGDYITKYPKDKHPVCPGKAKCPLRIQHPPNGEAFSLGCMLCRNQDY